jgi:hypothetical protein
MLKFFACPSVAPSAKYDPRRENEALIGFRLIAALQKLDDFFGDSLTSASSSPPVP